MITRARLTIQIAGAMLCILPLSFAQTPALPPLVSLATQAAAPLLTPDQLDNLVAPIALYPDPLLGQVLAASTYPLEIAEAQQWFRQNASLQGQQLIDAARQQNWDPSVQALVGFPQMLNLLGNDIRWTTDLGNAFLAQQADVMAAVQRMRARARANGRLSTTPQQVVTTETQDGQSAIEIEPANQQLIYVPVYQPEYVWGPGAYPDLWYPPGFGFGYGFEPGIYVDWLFPGWIGWGGWGWGCGWFGNGLFVNAGFFRRYGFRGGFGSGFGGRAAWQHDPSHRMGVAYPNRAVANRFSGAGRSGAQFGAGNRANGLTQSNRGSAAGANGGGWQRFGGGNRAAVTNGYAVSPRQSPPGLAGVGPNGSRSRNSAGGNRAAANGYAGSYRASPNYGYRAPAQSYRGYNSMPGYRSTPSYSAPRYSAPRSYSMPRSSSAPRSFGGGFSGGRSGFSSGGHSGGFSGGGHSGGGGRRR